VNGQVITKKTGDKVSVNFIVTNKFVGTKSLKELLTRLAEKEIKEQFGY
jgi:hypothetical protein